ncbi:MAG TPA: hypothetical protein VEI97_17260 [bacterium]|nr:hypothetical protein [bacterium]
MDQLWPWIALGIALLTLLYDARPLAPPEPPEPSEAVPDRPPLKQEIAALAPAWLLLLVGVVLLFTLALRYRAPLPALMDAAIGTTIGALLAAVADLIERARRPTSPSILSPLALALAAAALAMLPEATVPLALRLGVVLGACTAGGLVGAIDRPKALRWSSAAIEFTVTLAALKLLGTARAGEEVGSATILLGVVALFALVVAQAAGDLMRRGGGAARTPKPLVATIAAALFLGGTMLVNSRYLDLDLPLAMLLFGGGLVTAAIAAWLLPDEEEPEEGAAGLAVLLWVASAAVAFGLLQGFGMALWGLAGLLVGMAVDVRRATLSAGVLTGLLLYRLFLEHTGARGLDLAQHYGTVGLITGATVALTLKRYQEQLKDLEGLRVPILATGAGIVAAGGLLLFCAIAGAKGAAGLVVGLALAPAVALLKGEKSPGVLTPSYGLAAVLVLGFGLLEPALGMDREAKIRFLVYAAAAGFVLVLILGLLSRPPAGAGQPKEAMGDGAA